MKPFSFEERNPRKKNANSNQHAVYGLDRLHSRNFSVDPSNYSIDFQRSSKNEIHNLNIDSTNNMGLLTPFQPNNVKIGKDKDKTFEASLEKPQKVKLNRYRRLESSFEYSYNKDLKSLKNQKGKSPGSIREVLGHKEISTDISMVDSPPLARSINESTVDSDNEKVSPYSYSQKKRILARVKKNLINNYVNPIFPSVFLNGVELIRDGKRIKPGNFSPVKEKREVENYGSLNILDRFPKKESSGNSPSQLSAVMPKIKAKAIKEVKMRIEPNTAISKHYRRLLTDDLNIGSLKKKNFQSERSNTLSPARCKERDFSDTNTAHLVTEVSMLEAAGDSLNPKKRVNNNIFLERAFDKVNELINKNSMARYNLLRIQESALDLKMQLYGRRPQYKKAATKSPKT